MSHTRTVALFLSLAVLTLGVTQGSSASVDGSTVLAGTPGFTLVKTDWCRSACNQACLGACEDAFSVGCTCYWLCENGKDGETMCMGASPNHNPLLLVPLFDRGKRRGFVVFERDVGEAEYGKADHDLASVAAALITGFLRYAI